MIPTRLGLSDAGFLFCPEVIARDQKAGVRQKGEGL